MRIFWLTAICRPNLTCGNFYAVPDQFITLFSAGPEYSPCSPLIWHYVLTVQFKRNSLQDQIWGKPQHNYASDPGGSSGKSVPLRSVEWSKPANFGLSNNWTVNQCGERQWLKIFLVVLFNKEIQELQPVLLNSSLTHQITRLPAPRHFFTICTHL